MFNSGNNQKLASSVQRDYYQAADSYRLAKESGYEGNRSGRRFRVGLAVTAVATFIVTIIQLGIL